MGREVGCREGPMKSSALGGFFCILSVPFVRVLARKKMLNFPPEVVIWWTLKMYFWEVK